MDVTDPQYHKGQLWKYRTRRGEESSRVLINGVSRRASGEIGLHLLVSGISIRDPKKPGKSTVCIFITREAFARSVTALESEDSAGFSLAPGAKFYVVVRDEQDMLVAANNDIAGWLDQFGRQMHGEGGR